MRPILSAWSIIALAILKKGGPSINRDVSRDQCVINVIIANLGSKSVALASQTAFSILLELLKNKRIINILANLQAYFNNRRYFPILMLKFGSE